MPDPRPAPSPAEQRSIAAAILSAPSAPARAALTLEHLGREAMRVRRLKEPITDART